MENQAHKHEEERAGLHVQYLSIIRTSIIWHLDYLPYEINDQIQDNLGV